MARQEEKTKIETKYSSYYIIIGVLIAFGIGGIWDQQVWLINILCFVVAVILIGYGWKLKRLKRKEYY